MGVLFSASDLVYSRCNLTLFSMIIFIFAAACLAAHINSLNKEK